MDTSGSIVSEPDPSQYEEGSGAGIRSTRHTRAPIIDGLGHAPPRPRAAGILSMIIPSAS